MGAAISRLSLAVHTLKSLIKTYTDLSELLNRSPGIPSPDSSLSFWTVPPSPIAKHQGPWPKDGRADVVVIGSGITGTSVARCLLDGSDDEGLEVVMLEAREACSGATGRNGGHINPLLFQEYPSLVKKHGREMAQKMIRFRLSHLKELLVVAEEEDIVEQSQCRDVEALTVYYNEDKWAVARAKLAVWKSEMADESRGFREVERHEAVEDFHLSPGVVGCISGPGGVAHPYRLVTGILTRLLSEYPNFSLQTNTPCTSISPPSASSPFYTLQTPRGTITTSHIIHTTNAYVSHLLPPMRTKIFPARATMSAQRPGKSLTPSTADGGRSFVFYNGKLGYDYLTQLPSGGNELMFGGGVRAADGGLSEIGVVDDSLLDFRVAAYLSGALSGLFGLENWGEEGTEDSDEGQEGGQWAKGRVKALWAGIIGTSADEIPWVGRIPSKISGRPEPKVRPGKGKLASPGEWIAAGYSGEGMVHAWMSGKAVGLMVLGRDEEEHVDDWLPGCMKIDVKRWRKANVEDLVASLN